MGQVRLDKMYEVKLKYAQKMRKPELAVCHFSNLWRFFCKPVTYSKTLFLLSRKQYDTTNAYLQISNLQKKTQNTSSTTRRLRKKLSERDKAQIQALDFA